MVGKSCLSRRLGRVLACLVFPLVVLLVIGVYAPLAVSRSRALQADSAPRPGNYRAMANTGHKYRGVVPGNASAELLVLVQVNDLHVSKLNSSKEAKLRELCSSVVPAVKPRAVLALGDLVDGYSSAARKGGEQQMEEWVAYRGVLESTGMLSTPGLDWLDMRGNHDAYGVGNINDPASNMYEKFGVSSATNQGRLDKRTWRADFATRGNTSTFRVVGFDAAVGPVGTAKPFNFYGYLDAPTRHHVIEHLEAEIDDVPGSAADVTSSLLVGHYPESQVPGGFGSEIRSKVPYYLCGHEHRWGLYQRVKNQMLELHNADMTLHNAWRLMAFDHGQFSFSEQSLERGFPVGLVTNPKDARFMSDMEPNHASVSTHVRVLAYTDVNASVTQVVVYFDDNEAHPLAGTATAVEGGLYALAWQPQDHFASGLHTIHATIVDSAGRVRLLTHRFSLDGTADELGSSFFQSKQAVGDDYAMLVAMFLGIVVTNLLMLLLGSPTICTLVRSGSVSPLPSSGTRTEVVAGGTSSDDAVAAAKHRARRGCPTRVHHNAENIVAWTLYLALPLLLIGPYLIGFFAGSNGPVCFVFSFGIIVAGHDGQQPDLVMDPQALVFASAVQVVLVLPFICYAALRHQTLASSSFRVSRFAWSVAGFGLLHSHRAPVTKTQRFGAAVRWLLFPFFLIVLLFGPIAVNSMVDHGAAAVFLSPTFYFILFAVVTIAADMAAVQPDSADALDSAATVAVLELGAYKVR